MAVERMLALKTAAERTEGFGEIIVIPAGEQITFRGDLRDWRRVRVQWRGVGYLIARTAWESALRFRSETPQW
jgi:hypothetical protein